MDVKVVLMRVLGKMLRFLLTLLHQKPLLLVLLFGPLPSWCCSKLD